MTTFDRAAAFRRAADFMHTVEDRSYTRKETWSLGSAFFHEDYPAKWVLNFLRLEHDDPTTPVAQVVKEADDLMVGAGLPHRMLHVESKAAAERLRPGLEELGWRSETLLVMALASVPPVFHAPGVEVRELSQEEMYGFALQAIESQYPTQAPHAPELASSRSVTVEAADAISLGGCIDGRVAGYCDLYDGGDVGQVEEVNTFDEFRKRGVAKAVVTTAIDISRSRGHDLTFLVADDQDWPKDFYARLGFVPVGYTYEFRWSEEGL